MSAAELVDEYRPRWLWLALFGYLTGRIVVTLAEGEGERAFEQGRRLGYRQGVTAAYAPHRAAPPDEPAPADA